MARIRAGNKFQRPSAIFKEVVVRLRDAGLAPVRELGCGMQGCAWLMGDGNVAKITFKPEEAAAGVWLLEHRAQRLPSVLPVIHQVYRLSMDPPVRLNMGEDPYGPRSGYSEMFVLIREPLADLPPVTSEMKDLLAALNIVMASVPLRDALTVSSWQGIMGEHLTQLHDIEHEWGKKLLDFTDWAVGEKQGIWDLQSAANFGLRANGDIVIRDLGFTSFPIAKPAQMAVAGLRMVPGGKVEKIGVTNNSGWLTLNYSSGAWWFGPPGMAYSWPATEAREMARVHGGRVAPVPVSAYRALRGFGDARWCFETDCINSDGDSITAMNDAAVEISYDTMRKVVGQAFIDRQQELGYDVGSMRGGLRMKKDWAVSYHRSTYQGRPCYFFRWSHIEQIFTQCR